MSAEDRSLLQQQPVARANKTSHIDLYAKASDESLEKHLSLYHINCDGDIEQPETSKDTENQDESDVFMSPNSTSMDDNLHITSPIQDSSENVFVFPSSTRSIDNPASCSSEEFLIQTNRLSSAEDNEGGMLEQRRRNSEKQTVTLKNETDNRDDDFSRKTEETLLQEALQDLENTLEEEDEPLKQKLKSDALTRQSTPPQSQPQPTLSQSSISTHPPENRLVPRHPSTSGVKPSDSLSAKPFLNISKVKKTSLDSILKPPSFTAMKHHEAQAIEETSSDFGSREQDMKIVRGKPPLSPRSSFHGTRTTGESSDYNNTPVESRKPEPPHPSCDINSNDLVAVPTSEIKTVPGSSYLGPEVPLKIRLKSLAQEYEMEEEKRHIISDSLTSRPKPIANLNSTPLNSTHKRTRYGL